MAGSYGTQYWHTNTSNKVDVGDLIYQITPTSKPIYNLAQDVEAINIKHEWLTRSLSTYAVNASQEGFTYAFTTENIVTERKYNYSQILTKTVRVSETLQAVHHYAIEDFHSDQVTQRLAEWGTDAERAITSGTMVTGATDTARSMQGIANAIYSGQSTFTEDNNEEFSGSGFEDNFNEYIQALWNKGSEPRDVFTNGAVRRYISAFTSTNTMFQKAEDRTVINSVAIYETDFFPVEVHLHRALDVGSAGNAYGFSPSGTLSYDGALLFLDRTAIKKAWIPGRRPAVEAVPKTADAMDSIIVGEFTLEYGNPHMHAWVALTTLSLG